MSNLVLDHIIKLSCVPILERHRACQDHLIKPFRPLCFVIDTKVCIAGDYAANVRVFRHCVRHIQLQNFAHVGEREGSTPVEVIPRLCHVLLKWCQRWAHPLHMQLELRRWEVEACYDHVSDVLIRNVLAVHSSSKLSVLEERLCGFPQLRLEAVQKFQRLLGGREQKAPVRNVMRFRDAIQVTWCQCQHIIEDEHVFCLPSQ
mmetsp:Transcript_9042/g.16334  ORF Transcript_9042/g.16334 Transcript_9042/m.16334 type:complete len:203 (-) Transcript_9042:288-896(-)